MARASYIACLVLLLAMVAATSARHHGASHYYKHHLRNHHHARDSTLFGSLKSLVCIPTVNKLIEEHEGRQSCAYDHPKGYRAIGVGYNLDDDVDTRRAELFRMLLDYDKVYKGDTCLWDIQITTLLTLDGQRDLTRAGEDLQGLDEFCCEVQAVFADIQHSLLGKESITGRDLKGVAEGAALGEWSSAAKELEQSNWCTVNEDRCEDNVKALNSGCNSLIQQVLN